MTDVHMFDPLGKNSLPLGRNQEPVGDGAPLDSEGTHILPAESARQLSLDVPLILSTGPAVVESPRRLN